MMLSRLKKQPFVKRIVDRRDYIKNVVGYTFRPENTLRERFLRKCGYEPDLRSPKTYNEKLQWLKMNWQSDLVKQCADKADVRAYVEEAGYKENLIPVIGIYDSVEQIHFDELPDRFAIKATHGSGMNSICHDRQHYEVSKEKKKLKCFLGLNYYYYSGEWAYRTLKRRLICEQYLDTEDGKPPCDYKIYCFHGEPKCVMVAQGRAENRLTMDFFTPDWEHMPFKRHNPNSSSCPEKPFLLDNMLQMARDLSQPFPHVRVDLYEVKGKIYFGELTFFPASGMQPFEPFEYDLLFGSWLDLSKIK